MTNLQTKFPRRKILTVEGHDKISIPIVMYPPHKLRSSLYDKDPVIWVHLLESYIQLLNLLISYKSSPLEIYLDDMTIDQINLLIKKYLKETAEEQNNVLTLGAINPEINKNNLILKSLVYIFVNSQNFKNLNFDGGDIWNFYKVYNTNSENSEKIKKNLSNNSLSLTLLTQFFENLISNDKFNKLEFQHFGKFLGLMEKDSKKDFLQTFITPRWIQCLERYHGDGKSIHSKTCKTLMSLTLISCSTDKLFELVNDELFEKLEFKTRYEFIKNYYLLYKLLSSSFIKTFILNEEFYTKLNYLFPLENHELKRIKEMFPNLTNSEIKKLLKKFNNNSTTVINELIENPNLPTPKKLRSKYDNDEFSKLKFTSQNVILNSKRFTDDEELKKKSLISTLKLLNNPDEDEPDDTYIENITNDVINSKKFNQNLLDEKIQVALENNQEIVLERTKFVKPFYKNKFAKNGKNSTNTNGNSNNNNFNRNDINNGNKNNNSNNNKNVSNNKISTNNNNNNGNNKNGSKNNNINKNSTNSNNDNNNKNATNNNSTKSNDNNKTKDGNSRTHKKNEKNKSKVANHNRKQGHDKKLAKGY